MPADGGIRFGQYVLLRRIARGGMAEVFLAQQRGLEGFDRRVAVKRILPHLADTPDFVKMFLGEAKLAAQLTHPNIVHIYDFGKVDHDYFIAMEYVEGVHAGQVFKLGEREPRMTPTLVARIGADAAAALNYAHGLVGANGKALGLVHRDVSPANIMVSHDGIVKLCDFGIAKAMALTDQLTNPGQVKGKYAYMSPEQTVAAPLDGRSDVFSLAIVLWELLAGKTIVPRGDAVESMRMIRDGKLQPIDKAAPQTPPALAKAIAWALETKRDKRATAADFAQTLEAFIKASPELATPMQLAAWVRARFPRETSGQHLTLESKATGIAPGTVATPNTSAAPGTMAGVVTPSNLIAASVVSSPSSTDDGDNAETIAIVSSADLERITDEQAPPIPDTPISNRTTDRAFRAAEEPTAFDPQRPIVGDETIADHETILRPGSKREIVSSGPAVVPTRFERRIDSGARGNGAQRRAESRRAESRRGESIDAPQRRSPLPTEMTQGVRRQRPRYLVPAVALAGLAVASFGIALAARSCVASSPVDAADARVAVVEADAAATTVDAPAIDATEEPPDAREPTIRPDAAMPSAYLVVNTSPPGATVKIGDQTRVAPTSFGLPAGTYEIIAELDGYQTEKREVVLEAREHKTYEIAFKKKVIAPRPGTQTGKISVRTTPYSDVFNGTRRLGQSPFETELPAGTYTLLFRNPTRQTTTRTIKVIAGRTTKVVFDLPK